MKALTVQQPWAHAIMHLGKLVENRTQLWKYRGPLAIHAGLRWSERGGDSDLVKSALIALARERKAAGLTVVAGQPPFRYETGSIIGTVELVDCHPDAGCCRPWGESAYVEYGGRERRRITHLVLENPLLLTEPIPCPGALGLWTPTDDVLARINAALAAESKGAQS